MTRVTLGKSRVRESRPPGSVRAKPNGRATRPRPNVSLSCAKSATFHKPLRMKSAEKRKPALLGWALIWLAVSDPGFGGTSRFLFDFPRRVMRDVHRKIVAGTSQCRHCYTSKWLTPGDSLVLPGAAGDDMGATIHFRLRLVEVASIKGRENLVTIAVGQHASAVNVFLVAGRNVQRCTTC
jgi:hypothetical protein